MKHAAVIKPGLVVGLLVALLPQTLSAQRIHVLLEPRGIADLSAAAPGQNAYGDRQSGGFFTACLVAALQSDSGANVTWEDLAVELKRNVGRKLRTAFGHQGGNPKSGSTTTFTRVSRPHDPTPVGTPSQAPGGSVRGLMCLPIFSSTSVRSGSAARFWLASVEVNSTKYTHRAGILMCHALSGSSCLAESSFPRAICRPSPLQSVLPERSSRLHR